jgi:hypothetical protein
MTHENGCIFIVRSRDTAYGKAGEPVTTGDRRSLRYGGEKKRWNASRLAYHLNVAPIPRNTETKGQGHVLHSCDVDCCINPSHLRLGPHSDNMRDMWTRSKTIHANRAASLKEAWKDPQLLADHSARLKARWADPQLRAERSAAWKARWADPQWRAKMLASQRAAIVAKKAPA